MNSRTSIRFALTAMIFAVVLLTGCGGGGIQRFNITIQPDEGLRDPQTHRMPSMEMDLVGVGADDAAIRNMPVSDYFNSREGRQRRADLDQLQQKVTFQFSNEGHDPQTLPADHSAWDVWDQNNYSELMVVVDYLPGASGDDARRLFIPLDPERWTRPGSTLTITVQRSRLHLSPKPDAQ